MNKPKVWLNYTHIPCCLIQPAPVVSVVLGLPGQGFEVRQLTSEDEEVLMLGEPRAAVSSLQKGWVSGEAKPKNKGSIGLSWIRWLDMVLLCLIIIR